MSSVKQADKDDIQLPGSLFVMPEPLEPVEGRDVPAKEFLQSLRMARPARYLHCTIIGEVDITNFTVSETLTCVDCTFTGHFDGSNARFAKSLKLEDCKFQKSITLRGASIGGEFDVSDSKISLPEAASWPANIARKRHEYPYEPPPPFRSARWDGLTVFGSLRACCLEVEGSLDLGDCEVKGCIILRGAQIGLGENGGRLYLRQARVDGDVELRPWHPEAKQTDVARPPLIGVRTIIHGTMSIGSSVIQGRLNMRGAKIHGCLHAIMVRITGRVLADCWKHPEDTTGTSVIRTEVGTMKAVHGELEEEREAKRNISLYFQDSIIESAVLLKGLKTTGSLDFDNARIRGTLHMEVWHEAEVDPVFKKSDVSEWRPALVEESEEDSLHSFRTRIGKSSHQDSICLRNAIIEANFDAKGIFTEGRIAAHNVTVRGSILLMPNMLGPGLYVPTRIGRDEAGKSLSLYGAHIGLNLEFHGAEMLGALRMRYATVKGAVIGQRWRPGPEEPDGEHPSGSRSRPRCLIGATTKGQGLYLYGAVVEGNVCCDDIHVQGCFSLELAKVHGTVAMRRSRLGIGVMTEIETKSLPVAGTILRRSYIANDADFGGGTLLLMGFDATGAHIGGSLTMGVRWKSTERNEARGGVWVLPAIDSRVVENDKERAKRHRPGVVKLEGALIEGNWNARHLFVSDGIDGSAMTVRDEIHLDHAIVGRPRTANPVPTATMTEYAAAVNPWDLQAQIWPYAKVTERSLWEPAPATSAFVVNLGKASIGHKIHLNDAEIHGGVRLSHARVRGSVHLNGDIEGKLHLANLQAHGLRIDFPDAPSFPRRNDKPTHSAPEVFYDVIDLSHAAIGNIEVRGEMPWIRKLQMDGCSFRQLKLDAFRLQRRPDFTHLNKPPGAGWRRRGLFAMAVFSFMTLMLFFGVSIPDGILPEHSGGQHSAAVEEHGLSLMDHCHKLAAPCSLSIRRTLAVIRSPGLLRQHAVGIAAWSLYYTLVLWVVVSFYMRSVWLKHPFHFDKLRRHRYRSWRVFTWTLVLAISSLLLAGISWRAVLLLALLVFVPPVFSRFVLAGVRKFGQHRGDFWLHRLDIESPKFLKDGWQKTKSAPGSTTPDSADFNDQARAALFLSRAIPFSQEPYLTARANFERIGKRVEAADLIYWMSGSEIVRAVMTMPLKLCKWIYFVAAGSGAAVLPLMAFWGCYFMFSWMAVFSDPKSVEHPSTFVVPDASTNTPLAWPERTGMPRSESWEDRLEKGTEGWPFIWPFTSGHEAEHQQAALAAHDTAMEPEWTLQDGFWMALKVHVPLLHLFAKSKWEPASAPGSYYSPFGMRPLPFGMEYETYACIAQIMSYLTIPMLLTALRQFYKGQEAGGGHGAGHGHSHGGEEKH